MLPNQSLRSSNLRILLLFVAFLGAVTALDSGYDSEIQFNGTYNTLGSANPEKSLVSRLHIEIDQDSNASDPNYVFSIVLFEQNSIFSRGIFISSVLKFNPSTKQLAPKGPSKIYEEQVGIQSQPFSTDHINLALNFDPAFTFDPSKSLEQFLGSHFQITSPTKFQGKTIAFQINPLKIVTMSNTGYYGFIALIGLSQLTGFAIMCHFRLNKNIKFVRKLPIIPSLQACLMDILVILICLNYFDLFDYIWKIQLTFLVLKLPILIKYYTEPLFPAKCEARSSTQANVQTNTNPSATVISDVYINSAVLAPERTAVQPKPKKKKVKCGKVNQWTILFILTFLTIFGNITLYVISPEQINIVTLMLLGTIILENFAFNKRPKAMWYFWLFMVPKSMVVFYINYCSYNRIGAPIDFKSLITDICIGFVLMLLIFLQRVFRPRFLWEKKSQKNWIHGMRLTYLRDHIATLEKSSARTNSTSRTLKSEFGCSNTSTATNLNLIESTEISTTVTTLEPEKIYECGICWGVLAESKAPTCWSKIKAQFVGEKKAVRTLCGHNYHLSCLETWASKKKECPMCRGEIICK